MVQSNLRLTDRTELFNFYFLRQFIDFTLPIYDLSNHLF